MPACDHVAKVLGWTTVLEGRSAILRPSGYGCTQCDQTWDKSPSESPCEPFRGILEHDSGCECFGCKARTLKVAYSGIGGGDATTQKKWDKNLEMYRAARAQGIEPVGTKPSQVIAAIKQSEKTGTAFKAS